MCWSYKIELIEVIFVSILKFVGREGEDIKINKKTR